MFSSQGLSTDTCLSTSIHLNLSSAPNNTCENFLLDKNPVVISQTIDGGDFSELTCERELVDFHDYLLFSWREIHFLREPMHFELNWLFLNSKFQYTHLFLNWCSLVGKGTKYKQFTKAFFRNIHNNFARKTFY